MNLSPKNIPILNILNCEACMCVTVVTVTKDRISTLKDNIAVGGIVFRCAYILVENIKCSTLFDP